MKKELIAFLGSALAMAIVVNPGGADAADRRQVGSACQPQSLSGSDNYIDYVTGGIRNPYSDGVGNTSGNVICPALDDSYLPRSTLTTFNVHVNDGSTSLGVVSRACVRYWASTGGACGAISQTGTSFTGVATLTPALTYWGASFANDFGYLYLTLPTYHSGADPSEFRGAFYSN